MISGRKALNTLIHALAQQLHDLQDRILRYERFGQDSIASRTIGGFELMNLSELQAQHDQALADLRELRAISARAADQSMQDFVNSLRR
jgi:hypothetical protein